MNILAQAATSTTKALKAALQSLMDATVKQIQIRPLYRALTGLADYSLVM